MSVFIIFYLILAAIIGAYSRSKGGSFLGGFTFSILLTPILAGLMVAVSKPVQEELDKRALESGAMKACAACGELIRTNASKCRYCGDQMGSRSGNPIHNIDHELHKTCPMCAERIKAEARVCRFCGKAFSNEEVRTDLQRGALADDRDLVCCDKCGKAVSQWEAEPYKGAVLCPEDFRVAKEMERREDSLPA